MKKSLYIIAAVVAAGCAIGATGCGAPSRNVATLSSNWYSNTNFKSIQPTFTQNNTPFAAEEISYDVKFKKNQGGNFTYTVDYADGNYTTLFYAAEFDYTKKEEGVNYVCDEFRKSYEDAAKDRPVIAYYYKTELNIPTVKFSCNGKEEEFKDDFTVTECWFLSVENQLRPLYSRQEIKSASPANLQAATVESAYELVHYEYTCYYDYNGTSVKCEKTDKLSADANKTVTVTAGLDGAQNSLFDVAEYNILARALNLSETSFSQTVSVFTPSGVVGNCTLSGGVLPLPSTTDEDKQTKSHTMSHLTKNDLFLPKQNEDGSYSDLSTVAVTAVYHGSLNVNGLSQAYWFTAVENERNNRGRATMVRMEMPVPYNMGTSIYTLNEIKTTLWQK